MCAALPGLHAFTGCDYTSAFARKGKNRPYGIVTKNDKFHRAFASLSEAVPAEEVIKVLQDFVCVLYGSRKLVRLNKHRFNVVEKTYKRKSNAKYPFEKLKSIAGSSIPPGEAELAPHVDRSVFVARLWVVLITRNWTKHQPADGKMLTTSFAPFGSMESNCPLH